MTLRQSWQKILAIDKPCMKTSASKQLQAPITSDLPPVLEYALQEGDEHNPLNQPEFVSTGSKGYAWPSSSNTSRVDSVAKK